LEHYIIKKPDMGITKKETRTRTSPCQTGKLFNQNHGGRNRRTVKTSHHSLMRGFSHLGKPVLKLLLKHNVVRWGRMPERSRRSGMLQNESQSGFRVRGGDRGEQAVLRLSVSLMLKLVLDVVLRTLHGAS
jgi:hypothetical protein